MKSYTIEGKMSGTGNIHDIASENFDRVIKFRGSAQWAVVLAAYYGGKGYTTHETVAAACRQAHKIGRLGYSHKIIDPDGAEYCTNGGHYYAGDRLMRV